VPLSLYVPPGEDRLHFAVKNAGRGRAMSVEAYLLVGDSQEGYCYIPTLNVSEVYRGAFSFSPSSLNESTNLTLVLDPMQYVTELDEENNEYRIRWHLKDRLKIVGNPEFVEKGEGWVVISIDTSLPTRVSLLYSQEGFLFGRVSVVHNNTMAHQHTLNVSGLKPATTYRGAIRASAADGSFVESKPFYFTTLPPQDDTPPEGNLTHSNTSGLINISTTFWDPRSGMEYVDLFVNGEHIGRYVGGEGETSLRTYTGDLHVTARGVNRGGLTREMSILIRGEEKSYPRITLFSPEEGATYSWNVPIAIHYEDDQGVEQINFYVDGALIDSVVPEHTYRRSNAHTTWDSRNSPNGQHTISIEVRSLSGNVSTEEVTIYTDNVGVPRDPELLITRESVVRVGDRYRVTLRIRNVGEGRATMIRVYDRMRGFIPMVAEGAEPDGVDRRSGGLYCLWPNEWIVQLSAPPLDPGEECTVEYEAVPFLTWACMHHYLMGFWSIGEPKMGHTSMYTTWATYRDENYRREFTDRFYLLTHGINFEESVTQYMENRRYMTVTAPGRLSWNYGTEGAVAVIQEMAKLAELRDGAVVLLEENRASPLTPQNAWVQIVNLATFLAPEFFSGGYLFIVGNPDIVPTWEIVNPPLNVSYSDHPYGDLNVDNVPDVVVGRVPLDTPREIIRYLQVAEADASGRLRTRVRESAMVVIGSGDGVGAFMSAGKRAFDLLKRSFDHVDIRNMTDYYVVKEMTTISGSDIIAAVGKTSSLDLRMEVFFYNPGTGEVTALDLSTGRSRTWDAEDHAGKMLVGDIYRTYSGDEFLFPFWGVDTVTITYTEWKKSSFYRLHLPHTFGTPLILDDVDFDSEEEILTYYEESGGILTYNSEGIRESLIPCSVESGSDVLILTADSDSDPDVLILNYTDDKIVLNLSSGGNVVKEFPLEGEEGFVKAGRNSFYLYSPVRKMLYKVLAVEEDDEVRLKFEGIMRIEGFSGKTYLLLGDFLKDEEYLLALYSPSTGRLLLLNFNSRKAREEMNSDLPNLIKGRNFIFYRDHGDVNSWGGFLTSDDSFTLTDSTMRVPVVLSLACLTGNLGDGSLAKTFLKRGAGVFIGATEVSYRNKNNQAIKIVEHYSRGDPIGQAFLKWERELAGDGYHLSRWDLYWIREYNLYGDPAFGTVQLTPLTFAQLIMNTRGELSVELPELMVEHVGGEVVVSLPGGGHTPTPIPLPYISFEYDIGRETTVLEVSALPGEWEEVRVNLTPEPSYLRQIDGDGGFNATDVVPEEGFTYSVVDNPWGNRTL
ncbi:MAG: hypothetical protein J7L88_06085, partial [Thermoplasmata archaeon]|nr:hypothetical protein [Thermoplasmata archaeon]